MLRDRKADLPGAADNRVRALRRVLKWALKNEHVGRIPPETLKYVGEGFRWMALWTPEELTKFEARHAVGRKARLALALLMYTARGGRMS